MKKLLCISMAICFASFSNAVYSQSSNSIQNDTPRFSNWNLLKPNKAQFPTRAFGKPIQINGFTAVDKGNAKQAAEAFLKQEQQNLGIDLSALEFKSVRGFNKLNYVTFIQNHNGIDVLRTEVELRITNSGKVMAYGATYYNDIKSLNTVPSLSSAACVQAATKDIKVTKDMESIQSGSRLYILPVKKFGRTEFKLVYGYKFDAANTVDTYLAYVDAHSGIMIERKSLTNDAETKVKFVTSVNKISPTEPTSEVPTPYLNYKLGTALKSTDENGEATININSATSLSGSADSKYCSVVSSNYTLGKFNLSINPDTDTTINLDSYWNNHARNAYYYLNLGRNTLRSIDPEISSDIADRKIRITLDYESDQINAASGGEDIQVLGLQQTNNKMLEMSDVMLHEYGHSINRFFYTSLMNNDEGMINGACNEALADVFSVYISDNNLLAKGYDSNEPNEYIRNIDNDNCYPDSILNQTHHDGLILSGAFWDLKELTSLDYLKKVSHFAKYGLPDDEDTGLAFAEWFIEVLIVDDNMGDGNQDLSDGTPNFDKILTAFNKHKIGTDVFPLIAFSHSPVKDTVEALKNFNFNYSFNTPNSQILRVDSTFVVYTINNSENVNRIKATTSDESLYQAFESEIPVGSFVQYHIIAYTNGSNTPIYYYENNKSQTPYSFLVGFRTLLTDNFEQNSGWTFKATEDNATIGKWEIAAPDLSAQYMPDMIPSEDHSEVGDKFLVTDPVFDMNYFYSGINSHWTNGRTSVISPKYDLSKTKTPLISFYYWYMYQYFENSTEPINFNIYTSDDDGVNWKLASSINESASQWNRQFIGVEPSSAFRIKFEVDAQPVEDMLTYLLKAHIDDFSILYSGDEINAVNDIEANNQFSVFPNPANSNLYFQAINADKVEIYNSLGQLVKSVDIKSGVAEWNRTTDNGEIVPAGLYLCKTISGENTITKTIVVEN